METNYADELIEPIEEVRVSLLGWLAQVHVIAIAFGTVWGAVLFEGWPADWWARSWLLVITPAAFFIFLRAARTKVVLEDDGELIISNFWVTHSVPWRSVREISLDFYFLLRGWVQCVSVLAELPSEHGSRTAAIKLKATVGLWKHLRAPLISKFEELARKHGVQIDEALYLFGGSKRTDTESITPTASGRTDHETDTDASALSEGAHGPPEPAVEHRLRAKLLILGLVTLGLIGLIVGGLIAFNRGPDWLWVLQIAILASMAVIGFIRRTGPPLFGNPWRKRK